MEHPDKTLEGMYWPDRKDEYLELLQTRPLDRWVGELWLRWLQLVFGEPPTPDRREILLLSLTANAFTTHEFVDAAKWCERHCRRFPAFADFFECPEIERNADLLR